MNAKCFVDTNVLVYAHDRSTGSKHERALSLLESLWDSGNGILSTQVLQELCVTLRRKATNPLALGELRELVRDYSTWEVVVNSTDSVLRALEIAARYRISFWDAMILQAAEISKCSILYSEDLAAGMKFGSIQVLNPFAATLGN